MVFACLIIIVFKNQLLLEENYWWWFILETTLEVSGTFFCTYIKTSIVTMSFSCIISHQQQPWDKIYYHAHLAIRRTMRWQGQ